MKRNEKKGEMEIRERMEGRAEAEGRRGKWDKGGGGGSTREKKEWKRREVM